MTTYDWHQIHRELDDVQLNAFEEALSSTVRDRHRIETRYLFYRRRGYGIETSFDAALAWARNAHEQHERRKDHDTGVE